MMESIRQRLSARARLRRYRKVIAASGLFDPRWYLEQYPDVANSGAPALTHFLHSDADEGRNPHPLFDTAWYLRQYPDVATARINAFFHYLAHGAAEGRDPHPLFDTDWYLQQNPDAARGRFNPISHYLQLGASRGRNPSPHFDTKWYLEKYPDVAQAGLNPLLHYVRYGRAEGRMANPAGDEPDLQHGGQGAAALTAARVLERHFSGWAPLRVYHVPGLKPRITMVTDSLSKGSLFGGVATSIVLAALLARRTGASLRVLTRRERADAGSFRDIIKPNGIELDANVEFVYAAVGDEAAQIDVGDHELFLTTSWWTTQSVLQTMPAERIVYLLQEDERMFYPHAEERLRCSEVLQNPRLRFVVNSQLLFRHFAAEGLSSIRDRGLFFEPAFPEAHFHAQEPRQGKRRFAFYARPHNLRNLYYRGLEAIEAAIDRGVLSPDEWDFYFVGKDLAPVTLAHGCKPTLAQNLRWTDYAALLRSIDVGLCLMYTPHPSYPPLDLAACGAVAVTNKHGLKHSLDAYSKNILCTDADVESLVEGLRSAVKLSGDAQQREDNFRTQALLRDWSRAFAGVLDALSKGN